MKRRPVLIALAIALPLAIFGAAKWVTRFRPVVIGKVSDNKYTTYYDAAIHAGPNVVVAGGGNYNWRRFDLTDGTRRVLTNETLVEGTDITMRVRVNAAGTTQMLLSEGASAPIAYDLREKSGPNARPDYPGPNPDNYEAHGFSRRNLRVSPALNRVEIVWRQTYYRWNRTTRALERRADLGSRAKSSGERIYGEKHWALTRDGETLVWPNNVEATRFSTRTGKRIARVKLPASKDRSDGSGFVSGWIAPSPYGAYALHTRHVDQANSSAIRLLDLRAGRSLWNFDVPSATGALPSALIGASPSTVVTAFAPDEKTVALARASLDKWEIRETQTGHVLRTLPLLPDTESAAFSPDGNTLYSVAKGVLYRQRAR